MKKQQTRIAGPILAAVFKVAITVAVIVLIYTLSMKAYDFGYSIFSGDTVDMAPGKTIEVTIVKDKSVKDIGEILEEAGLVDSGLRFWACEWFSEYHGDIQPGVYALNSSMTPEEMIAIMAGANSEEEEEE